MQTQIQTTNTLGRQHSDENSILDAGSGIVAQTSKEYHMSFVGTEEEGTNHLHCKEGRKQEKKLDGQRARRSSGAKTKNNKESSSKAKRERRSSRESGAGDAHASGVLDSGSGGRRLSNERDRGSSSGSGLRRRRSSCDAEGRKLSAGFRKTSLGGGLIHTKEDKTAREDGRGSVVGNARPRPKSSSVNVDGRGSAVGNARPRPKSSSVNVVGRGSGVGNARPRPKSSSVSDRKSRRHSDVPGVANAVECIEKPKRRAGRAQSDGFVGIHASKSEQGLQNHPGEERLSIPLPTSGETFEKEKKEEPAACGMKMGKSPKSRKSTSSRLKTFFRRSRGSYGEESSSDLWFQHTKTPEGVASSETEQSSPPVNEASLAPKEEELWFDCDAARVNQISRSSITASARSDSGSSSNPSIESKTIQATATANEIEDVSFGLKSKTRHDEQQRYSAQVGASWEKRGSGLPVCDACGKPTTSYLSALGKKYHHECFRCTGCHEPIDPSEHFTFTMDDNSVNAARSAKKHPMHRKCYSELFGKKCTVCFKSIPKNDAGKISYMKHPFFNTEIMCPGHAGVTRRCSGCHRFEPSLGSGFADLGDGDRCVCLSCCRSLVVDNADAAPLWEKVMVFFKQHLGLPLWESMDNIPILVVGQEVLTESSIETTHSHSSQIMTRGLCLSEHRNLDHSQLFLQRSMHSDNSNDCQSQLYTNTHSSSITAILCLMGLPADLTASILAHEATHAWFKLHPDNDPKKSLPPDVEEGCCQLVAYLFLCDGLDPPKITKNNETETDGPSDERLRQYFKFSIETDTNEIYGEGFRRACKAYTAIGIEPLLNHVVQYRSFPDV